MTTFTNLSGAAKILEVDVRTVKALIAEGRLPAAQVTPRLWRIRVADVEALLPQDATGTVQ